ncbi:MAG: hypothetical protein MPEBLZ_02169 [Candidatus Methanoperedens nitroreducens]|uniref:Uncharacterized protein n=1 Tax=Candidatus Methanoperedens nitratireducens TaxID=1392998 RepID=A0A0P8A9F9_9EURY|nr:hypothetical protein [Candidatus Methanoperedens sp. BLZ2]KAB2941876.1 MAG: hypothetical protein F9K14_17990 [Candidatus Methanoperedens sp.]KPQ43265.1 MAG: hypothetical protein MPEBLZ_02169 [Candidatus Methanoperedens sp. BLZ1]MBZ0175954.1 hypothetical protein [Candidatus Methanoperedens nitroreducens]MCX9078991.1 hypothetical protein [Candidatus Methanoperedens sp.]
MVIGDYGAAHRKAGNEHEKNNELIRTETNSDSMSLYGVRTSSLLIFFILRRKERKAQPQFRTRMTRIFMDNILSEKSINSTYPNEPQSTQRAQRFFKPISVSSVHSVVLTFRKFDPRLSASTVASVDVAHTYGSRHAWRSAFHHVCSSLKSPASGASVSALIGVHLRFFIDVIFQTGLTGSTGYVFNPVHPVILSNLKRQFLAPHLNAKLMEG